MPGISHALYLQLWSGAKQAAGAVVADVSCAEGALAELLGLSKDFQGLIKDFQGLK